MTGPTGNENVLTHGTRAVSEGKQTDCYIGIKPCGCMVAWVYDDPKYLKDTAETLADFIRSGYSVERVTTDEVRNRLGKCKCSKEGGK